MFKEKPLASFFSGTIKRRDVALLKIQVVRAGHAIFLLDANLSYLGVKPKDLNHTSIPIV
jgi:hypothetical protein